MPISSQASKEEGSETIPQGSRPEVGSKRPAPTMWGEDIVRSSRKREAVKAVIQDGSDIDASGCWVWRGGKSHGYGQLRLHDLYGAYPLYAHRVAYVAFKGPIENTLFVCHHCDNPYCCNPGHLFVGTQTDNLRDMSQKGRALFGGRNPQSKLTAEAVDEIRRAATSGERQFVLAARFGVSQAQISRIVRGVHRGVESGPIRRTHGNAKLTAERVAAARVAVASGASISSLAKVFGVHSATLGEAVYGETWKHVLAAPVSRTGGNNS